MNIEVGEYYKSGDIIVKITDIWEDHNLIELMVCGVGVLPGFFQKVYYDWFCEQVKLGEIWLIS
jgi:hypothetical protein